MIFNDSYEISEGNVSFSLLHEDSTNTPEVRLLTVYFHFKSHKLYGIILD